MSAPSLGPQGWHTADTNACCLKELKKWSTTPPNPAAFLAQALARECGPSAQDKVLLVQSSPQVTV